MKYQFGVIDPPWEYSDKQGNDPKRGGISYPVLTMKDLYNIPIGDIFDPNEAMIAVWVTSPKMVDLEQNSYSPLSIIRQWGFLPVTIGLVWVKTYSRAQSTELEEIEFEDFYSGLGRYTNSNIEFCIFARRKKGLERVRKDVKQLIIAPIGKHSEKPREQQERYNALWGIEDRNIPAIELFARKQNPPPSHYDAVGLDWLPSIDIKDFIKQYEQEFIKSEIWLTNSN